MVILIVFLYILLPVYTYNFEKNNDSFVDTLNTPYDYASVMHYTRDAFSHNNLSTIEPLQANVTIGQRLNLSSIDILEVRLLYNCSAIGVTLPPITNDTTSESTTHFLYSQNSNLSVAFHTVRENRRNLFR